VTSRRYCSQPRVSVERRPDDLCWLADEDIDPVAGGQQAGESGGGLCLVSAVVVPGSAAVVLVNVEISDLDFAWLKDGWPGKKPTSAQFWVAYRCNWLLLLLFRVCAVGHTRDGCLLLWIFGGFHLRHSWPV
jgi:hypothetical protein